MNSTRFLPILALGFALCMNTACSTAGHSPGAPETSASTNVSAGPPSSFEITYSLGERGLHRLVGNAGGALAEPRMASYLERSVIEKQTVRADRYDQYFAKVLDFTRRAQRMPSQNHECRTPYSIVVKISGKTYSSKGCRGQNDSGSFGKLVREGEFLLYSKK